MHSLHLWITCAALCFTSSVQAASEIKPVGILRTDKQTVALFDEFFSPPRRFQKTLHLARGEHASSSTFKQNVSVTLIDPSNGLLQLKRDSSNEVLHFKSALPGDGAGIILEDASVSQVLAVYSGLANKNILPYPNLSEKLFTLTTEFADSSVGAGTLRKTLTQAQVVLMPFSESFEIAVPKNLADQKFDRKKFLKPTNPNKRLETGWLELFGTPMPQLLDICGDLLGLAPNAQVQRVFGVDQLSYEIRLVASATSEEVTDALQLFFQWQGFDLTKTGGTISVTRRHQP